MIADAEGPTSIAGVKGGARSEVRPETTRVLLEVATWSGPNIHRTSWSLGLRSEASGRFEKGLAARAVHARAGRRDEAADRVLRREGRPRHDRRRLGAGAGAGDPPAGGAGARRSSGCRSHASARRRSCRRSTFRRSRHRIPEAPERDGLDVTVPALRRVDVTREVDLIEEVARIDGLEKLPATLPARRGAVGLLEPRPAGAPRGRGRARRPRPARGRRLELHRPRPARPAAPARRARAAAGGEAGEPDVGDPVDDAPDVARLAAGCRAAQRRAQRPGRGDLRVRGRVPCLRAAGAAGERDSSPPSTADDAQAPRRSRNTTRSARC